MQDILIMEEVDVRRADDPDDSRVLTINKMGLPSLKRKEAEHTAGGSVGTIAFLLPQAEAMEPKFSTKGLDLGVLRKFGFSAGRHDKWTFAASLRNKMDNRLLPVRSTIRGIVSEWAPGEHTPGELLDCDHTIKEVSYVDLFIDDEEIFAWSFYGRFWRSGGIDLFAEYRIGLGV